MKKYMKYIRKISLVCILSLVILSNFTYTNAASKDTKLPTITLLPNKKAPTKGTVKVTIKATDASGIKTVKWATGAKSASKFKKKGLVLRLNSKSMATVTIKKNNTYTFYVVDKAGNIRTSKIKIANIDNKKPTLNLSYKVSNQVAPIKVVAKDTSGIKSIQYIKGRLTDVNSTKWSTKAKVLKNLSFNAKSPGNYSILATDKAGNKTAKTIKVNLEFRAVWISYLEFKKTGYTESEFKAHIDKMFDNTVALNMNAVIVQVRPFGDALYPSNYFPWSIYVSGKQGKDPGYDPLKYMVSAAHKRGLEFHAWLNPYRVTHNSTNYSSLSKDNPARIWHEDNIKGNDRNVLSFNKNLYYNPASSEAQNLIIDDITDIVENYEVDGIHFDDYFYPTLTKAGTPNYYKSSFDYKEYNTYKKEAIKDGKTPKTIEVWRRNNVNNLVKGVYAAIKKADSKVVFGISPQGNITNLKAKDKNYVDIETWLSSSKYVDYIAPQIYWTFQNPICPFDKTVDHWLSIRTSDTVNMYIGIANYRAKSNLEPEWEKSDDVLKRQVEYSRKTGEVDGFLFFRYEFFFKEQLKVEVDNLLSIMK